MTSYVLFNLGVAEIYTGPFIDDKLGNIIFQNLEINKIHGHKFPELKGHILFVLRLANLFNI